MINHLVTFLATAGSLMEKSLLNLLFSNIDKFWFDKSQSFHQIQQISSTKFSQ